MQLFNDEISGRIGRAIIDSNDFHIVNASVIKSANGQKGQPAAP